MVFRKHGIKVHEVVSQKFYVKINCFLLERFSEKFYLNNQKVPFGCITFESRCFVANENLIESVEKTVS